MPWNTLSARLAGLPFVLSGPVLRRVDTNSVSVWIATKHSSTVWLNIMNESHTTVVEGHRETVQLGEFLHVAVVTAKSDDPDPIFHANQLYFYNLFFDNVPTNTGTRNNVPMVNEDGTLHSDVLVNARYQLPDGLAYADYAYPSFILPSSDMNHLKVAHGSCRKPHGGGEDALSFLDHILAENTIPLADLLTSRSQERVPALNDRPQALFHTGDQIYADDVADALLFTLMDASDNLLLWRDSRGNFVPELLPQEPTSDQLKPGERQALVAPAADKSILGSLSSSEAKSHLIKLGEFYAMYLFVWSDVLWPADLPDYGEVFPQKETKRTVYGASYYGGNDTTTEVDTTHYKRFKEERAYLHTFRATLPQVRKALANIPSYMIFDDHEVTDDWFLTFEWADHVLRAGLLSQRIVLNGLTAFAVFQAWGNTPAPFADGDGAVLLSQLAFFNTMGGASFDLWRSIENLLLPTLNRANKLLEPKFSWNFTLEWPNLKIVLLDIRTQRAFKDAASEPQLIHIEQMYEQLDLPPTGPLPFYELVMIISPTPIFGNIFIEKIQKATKIAGLYYADQEAWSFQALAFQTLLKRLLKYQRVLVLSGDVHYAFSLSAQYWDEETEERAVFGQLCASSFKNSDGKTQKASRPLLSPHLFKPNLGVDAIILPPPVNYEFLGWNAPGIHVSSLMKLRNAPLPVPIYVSGEVPVHEIDIKTVKLQTPPDWRYQFQYANDDRTWQDRYLENPFPNPTTQLFLLLWFYHKWIYEWNAYRTVVGKANIGIVSFDWSRAEEKQAVHQIWYIANPDSTTHGGPRPRTLHVISLKIPAEDDPRPGDFLMDATN